MENEGMKRRAVLAAGAGGFLTSLAGCTALREANEKPVDRARVVQNVEASVENEGIEVIRTFSDWYGEEARDYRLWHVTESNSSVPDTSEIAVVGNALAEHIPSHDYARGLLVSTWPDPEQEGERWNYYVETEWAFERIENEIDEETYVERIGDTLSDSPP